MNNTAGKKNKRGQVFLAAAIAVLALLIIGSAAVIVMERNQPAAALKEYQSLSAEAHTSPATVDFDLLREKNAHVCAWLLSEGTGIDYPVVQAEDDGYYRRHLFSGGANSFGCLYIDSAQQADFSGKNTVIYGGAQLDSIYKYARQGYYDLLPSMTLCTPDRAYTVLLFAGVRTEDISEAVRTGFADGTEFPAYISWLKEQSVFRSNVSVSENDSIVTLCASNGEEGFLLAGKLV